MKPQPSAQRLTSTRHQRGVALIIGLVILVVLALLGASAYSVATADERIAGNARDHARAMDAAETMLRDCEYAVQNTVTAFDGSVAGMYGKPAAGSTWRADDPAQWTSATTYVLPAAKMSASAAAGWSQAPQCIAEEFPMTGQVITPGGIANPPATMKLAHVTARGFGLNRNTVVTLVSYVAFY